MLLVGVFFFLSASPRLGKHGGRPTWLNAAYAAAFSRPHNASWKGNAQAVATDTVHVACQKS